MLADIYIDLNKTFQAKATLESVIDNYKVDLVNEAIRKMEFIIAKEKGGYSTKNKHLLK